MAQPLFTTVLRLLHVGSGWVAFGAGPIALLALKGSPRHLLAGRCFLLALLTGITAGLGLAVIDRAIGLFCFGLLMLFLLSSGYLAPRIARGSRRCYRWDRVLTAVGVLGSLGLIGDALIEGVLSWSDGAFGGLGLGIALAHLRWRGPLDPARWQTEHLTSLLPAYAVVWSFLLALYIPALPQAAILVVPVLGLGGILWARRRFGPRALDRDAATSTLTDAA
jgi:hypothetical protein